MNKKNNNFAQKLAATHGTFNSFSALADALVAGREAEAFRLLGGKAAAPVPGSAPVKKDAVGFMPAGDL